MQEKKAINVTVGVNIKKSREKAGLTQEELSERIGMGVKNLSAIERGVVGVSLTSLRNICDVLGVSADALLYGEDRVNDVSDITARLERLEPAQLEVVRDMLRVLLTAFSLESME